MKWTLVTGSGKRLGAAICQRLAEKRHHLLIHYRQSEAQAYEVRQTCQTFGVCAEVIKADFSTMVGIDQILSEIKERNYEIENIINNVGNFSTLSTLNTPINQWLDLFQTNLHAPFALIQGLKSNLIANQGSVINIGTAGVADLRGNQVAGAYMLTKKALLMLTKSLAKELANDKVRVNMVSPGVLENSVTLPEKEGSIPFARTGELKEICRVVEFLLDRNSSYITGQNIEIAGGYGL